MKLLFGMDKSIKKEWALFGLCADGSCFFQIALTDTE